MNNIEKLIKSKSKPKIAVAVSDRESNKILKKLTGIGFLELRIDRFAKLDIEHIKNVIAQKKQLHIPLILTVRSREEGGERKIPDSVKLEIFREIVPSVDAVDIELKSDVRPAVVELAKKNKKVIIISVHNLKSTPADSVLKKILDNSKKAGADIVKIAAKANKTGDVIGLMEFTLKNRNKNLITISLGKIGAVSRLIFPLAGSILTYTYIDKPSGEGQIPLKKLQDDLRFYYS